MVPRGFLHRYILPITMELRILLSAIRRWKASKSPILMDIVFDGEHYDARLEQEGWSSPGFNDSGWKKAVLRKAPEGALKAQMSYPDRVMERIDPVKIEKLGDGHYRVDFGQEISGWLNISRYQRKSGTEDRYKVSA